MPLEERDEPVLRIEVARELLDPNLLDGAGALGVREPRRPHAREDRAGLGDRCVERPLDRRDANDERRRRRRPDQPRGSHARDPGVAEALGEQPTLAVERRRDDARRAPAVFVSPGEGER